MQGLRRRFSIQNAFCGGPRVETPWAGQGANYDLRGPEDGPTRAVDRLNATRPIRKFSGIWSVRPRKRSIEIILVKTMGYVGPWGGKPEGSGGRAHRSVNRAPRRLVVKNPLN